MESTSLFSRISRLSVYALTALVAVWFLPITQNALDFQKQTLLLVLALIGVISWMAGLLQAGEMRLRFTWQLPLLAAFLVVGIASTVFSLWPAASFWGFPLDITNSLLTQILFVCFAFLVMNAFSETKQLFRLLFVALVSAAVACLFAGAQIFQAFSFLPFAFAKTPLFNTIGNPNGVAVIAAVLLPLTLVLAFISKLLLRTILWMIVAVFFATLVFVQFSTAWLVLISGLLVLLAFGMLNMRKRKEFGWVSLPMGFLVFSLFFLLVPMQLPGIPQLPPEVSPSWQGELSIIGQTFKERALLGSGPGTFVFDYSKFHSPALNQTMFWGTRFSAGAAQVLDIAATSGGLGIAVFIALVAMTLFVSCRKLFGSNLESGQNISWMMGLGMTASFAAMVVSFTLYQANFTTWFAFWLLLGGLGMFASREIKVSLAPPSLMSVASSFTFLLVLVFGLGLVFVGGQKYAAELYYMKSATLAQQGDVEGSIGSLQTALRLNPGVDLYWRDIAQLFLARVGVIGKDESLSPEQKQQQTQVAINNAATAVRNATTVAVANVANWNVQGSVYQNLLAVAGAKDLAIQAYEQATKLEPASPFAWGELGRVYALFADQASTPATLKDESLQKALENLDRAIQLKSDYAPAHFLKAAAYELQGKSAEAASQLETLKATSLNDVGLAFQLGTLYWQKGDVVKAQLEFIRAKQLNPKYSNALYMLGLTYDKQGNKDAALLEFKQVAVLNPQDEGVKTIVANLEGGKPALDGIVPAQPPVQQAPPEINQGKP
ncbi:MAG: hypothetical protein Q7R48_01235 [bacterium]|nr:hypothetical protein [bacterium]